MKLGGISRALALAGTIGAGAGLSGCHDDENIKYLKSQPDMSVAMMDSIQHNLGRFRFGVVGIQYATDSVRFTKKADTAISKARATGFEAGKQFVLDSLAKAEKVAKAAK